MDMPTRSAERRNRRLPLAVGGNDLLLRLAPREARRLRVLAPMRLEVLRGRAWVTVDGEPDDHFPARGEHLSLRAGGSVLVSGDSAGCSTLLRLTAPAMQSAPMRGLLAWLSGDRSWAGG